MSTHAPHAARHTSPYLLSASQLVFNIGFYAVVPFLAIYLRDDMLLSGGLIGTIIGLRTFSQQGMFLLGGALSDRYGARAIILCGCVVRITGYLLLALGGSLWAVVLGACLTGVGGALFSPSIESLLAQAGTRSRAEWFALFAVCGELGAVLGPVLGSLMAGFGFKTMALAGAGVFIVALVALFILLPRTPHRDGPLQIVPWWQTFHQPRFVAFILAYSAYLYSYNQLYLALPVELRRSGSSDAALGPLFILASLLIITLQLPLARISRRFGAARMLPLGFGLLAASFVSVALFAPLPPFAGWLRLLPAACMVTLLTLGQMIIVPVGMDLVPRFAAGRNLGAHYGALASMGGVAVLTGNFLLGDALDNALTPGPQAAVPWLLLAVFPLCSALAMAVLCRFYAPKG
ncbi:MFS transporter [Cronobacter sakazakii]|nr:MFS transporter [Cronobacter sakazakii]EIX1764528.1 MFS transporter [Cronobacter sakazakii]EIX6122812.1 MFS transporter [Cronobacter sakazakii]EIX6211187.1 MFS transporter [Cronobacter sakazakii]EKC6982547.1 MFS transporter [Cronobacter sakazakii]